MPSNHETTDADRFRADLVFLRLHLQEPASAFEHFKGLPIHYLGYAIRDSGNAVMQVHLAGGNVNSFVLFLVKTGAAGNQGRNAQQEYRARGNAAALRAMVG